MTPFGEKDSACGQKKKKKKMASAKSGERGSSSFAMACSLLSRYVRQNGAAAGELGLGIRGHLPFFFFFFFCKVWIFIFTGFG